MRMMGLSALGIAVVAGIAYIAGADMAPGQMVATGKALGWCVLPIVFLVGGALWDRMNGQ